jgi:hypothetical protein
MPDLPGRGDHDQSSIGLLLQVTDLDQLGDHFPDLCRLELAANVLLEGAPADILMASSCNWPMNEPSTAAQRAEQLDYARIICGLERCHASDGEGGNCSQEIRQLSGGSGIEMQIGAVGQPGDFAEYPLDVLVLALLQHEDGNLESAEVGGGLAEAV